MKRRSFLKNTSLLGAGVGLSKISPLLAEVGGRSIPCHLVVDFRCLRSQDIDPEFLSRFENIYRITSDDDITDIWYNNLYYHWQDRKQATFAVTEESKFFVLKTLAKDQNYELFHKEYVGGSIMWAVAPYETNLIETYQL